MQFDFVDGLFVLMLATFIGLDVIRRVSRLLHTPLMSLTNAISAIAVVGAILLAGEQESGLSTWLGAIAVFASPPTSSAASHLRPQLKMFRNGNRRMIDQLFSWYISSDRAFISPQVDGDP